MATERQIEANRKNAARSTGPRTDEGKARSRLNATKHGMAGELPEVEAMASTEFLERREKWAAELQPVGEAGDWALDRVVASSLRIERCERALDQIVTTSSERARFVWDQDRAVEAALIFNRLEIDPVLASRQLQTTSAGVGLLLEAWLALAASLHDGDWSEAEVARALDLLGVPLDCRASRTIVDDPAGGDPIAYRSSLTFEEIQRLEALRADALTPLDLMEQQQAATGDLALLSKPAKLVLRYERDAWRRYRESMRQVRGEAKGESLVAEMAPSQPVAQAVKPMPARKPVVAESGRTFEEERRALQAMVAPIRELFAGQVSQADVNAGPDWLNDLERRLDRDDAVTERSQFAVGRA